MSAYEIVSAVIPERVDDALSPKYLVVVPEDRIVWVATPAPGRLPDLSPEGRKRAVTNAEVKSLLGKLGRQHAQELDMMALACIRGDMQCACDPDALDCWERDIID